VHTGKLPEEVVAIEFLVLPVKYNTVLCGHTSLADLITSVNK
jgi:hypothetical protein